MWGTILLQPPYNTCQWSINISSGRWVSYTAMNLIALFLNWVFNRQSFQCVLVSNFTTMHAMSHQLCICLHCSSTVNIEILALFFKMTYHLTVSQVELDHFQLFTAMSESVSSNTLLLEDIISSQNHHVCIHDFSHRTLQIVIDKWWTSMNVDIKHSIAWNNSRHAPLWGFYLHCGIDKIDIPCITYNIYHQVLHHSSEHGTSFVLKHLLAKADIKSETY